MSSDISLNISGSNPGYDVTLSIGDKFIVNESPVTNVTNVTNETNQTIISGNSVMTVAELRASTGLHADQSVTTKDFGGGTWTYAGLNDGNSPDDTATTIITADNKVWKKISTGRINLKAFGGNGDGVTSNTTAIQNAITFASAAGVEIFISAGVYKSAPFIVPSGVKLVGEGTCDLPFYTAGDVAQNIKGTILLISGQTNDICVELPASSRNNSIRKMSIYNDTTNAIKSVVKVSNLNLYAWLSNVEIGCTKVTAGDGLTIEGNTLYGTYEDVVVNITGVGQSYEASVRRGLVLHATGNTNRPNANAFIRGEFRGAWKSMHCVSDVNNAKFQGTSFAGTCFEGTYKTGMEMEYIPSSSTIPELTRVNRYAVKWVSMDNIFGMSFSGCYGELAGWPSTYDDGTNGVNPVVPVWEIGSTVINLSMAGHGVIGHLLDKSYISNTYNRVALQDQNGSSYMRSVTSGNASMLLLGSGSARGVAVRENKLVIANAESDILDSTTIQNETLQNHGTSYFGSNIRVLSFPTKTGATGLLIWDSSDGVIKTATTISGLTSINDIEIVKGSGGKFKLSDSNNSVEMRSVPIAGSSNLAFYIAGVLAVQSTDTAWDFKIAATGDDATVPRGFVNKNQLDNKKAAASADAAASVGATYSQSEVQAILTELRDLKAKLRTANLLA